jgi:hypothetical protein
MCVTGCARLSGDHEADDETEQQAAKMERLLDDAPESLKDKAGKPDSKKSSAASSIVADDSIRKSSPASNSRAMKSPSDTSFQERASSASVQRPANPFSQARRPGAKKPRVPKIPKSDEIPNAADVGL